MTTETRDSSLDILAHGSRCTACKAEPDESCKTRLGNLTYPHRARIDRAVRQYQSR